MKTSRDAANERDFWEYVKLDPRNLEFAMQIAFYIANVLEDGYIEGRILADFPGVLGYNLSVMRDHQYQDMRTVTQMMETEDAGSGHIFHTILQIMLSYALYGEIKYGETPLSDERIQTIFRLKTTSSFAKSIRMRQLPPEPGVRRAKFFPGCFRLSPDPARKAPDPKSLFPVLK
ncbi:MAG: hypothetical protein BHW31_02320 [Firmicutes bacterium CAG:110_56_8]|nr:MAG: hypothetical protein BHW31_02320 [Firmicutes bacterium CAG:110_56_8]